MKIPTIWRIKRWTRLVLRRDPEEFLRKVSGIIHVGANTGQERDLYEKYGLRVIWIEPIPEVFNTLKANIRDYPNQQAFRYLVTDQEDVAYEFHISNKNGVSSSILDLKLHKDIWPHVTFEKTITLQSVTLASLLKKEQIDISKYDTLIIDTQGSELLILWGAIPILRKFKYIKTEVADFESYVGCCLLSDLNSFLVGHAFTKSRCT